MSSDERPVRLLIGAIAHAAARWQDAAFAPRVRTVRAVCARTGYSGQVVNYALDRLFASVTREAIETTIASELGSLDVLDGFVERSGSARVRVAPLGRICFISSRTTIGVALVPAIFALCAKCTVMVKDREDALIAAFFETLAEEFGAFRNTAIAASWQGDAASHAFEGFDAVVAFGSDDGLAAIARTLSFPTRFIGFGSKASCGYIGREALTDSTKAERLAAGAARDVSLYDTQGCLSLHVLFVERGGSIEPERFAGMLATAMERAAVEFPVGHRDDVDLARLGEVRRLADFRAAEGIGRVFTDDAVRYLIVFDPPRDQPPPFLPRAVVVLTAGAPADASAYLRYHGLPIEAVAVAPQRTDILEMAIAGGAARIAQFGALQMPSLADYHGGRPRIAEFVRWVNLDDAR